MAYEFRAPVAWAAARLLGTAAAALMLLTAAAAAPALTAAESSTPVIWTELIEMREPCKENCTRDQKPLTVAIVGTGFGPYATVQVRFVSLDGTRESFSVTTEAYTADGRFTVVTGERVCIAWDASPWTGDPLEPSGLPDEHAWEVRASALTSKPGAGAATGSNILFLFTCGDGPVG